MTWAVAHRGAKIYWALSCTRSLYLIHTLWHHLCSFASVPFFCDSMKWSPVLPTSTVANNLHNYGKLCAFFPSCGEKHQCHDKGKAELTLPWCSSPSQWFFPLQRHIPTSHLVWPVVGNSLLLWEIDLYDHDVQGTPFLGFPRYSFITQSEWEGCNICVRWSLNACFGDRTQPCGFVVRRANWYAAHTA